ncbi:MAG TPA: PLP-dependent aminotransferase family protein [Flavobacterium sp.]|jgi:DNA-binding transcriptional MocR family regulator
MESEIKKEFLYLEIAKSLENQIRLGILKFGDKLPSIRMICSQHGVSMSTAQLAYQELESKSLILSRPQSGYYVSYTTNNKLGIPTVSRPKVIPVKAVMDIFDNTVNDGVGKDFMLFSRGVPATSLLPVAKLNKGIARAVKSLPGGGTGYESLKGNEKLRAAVAKSAYSWNGNLSANDILTTPGCISAISYCLMALTKRGDTIAVESPSYYTTLHLAQSLGLNVLELQTHPQTGIEMESFEKVLATTKLAACLFVSNFNNPFGSLMPEAHKKEAVRLLEKYNVPLIEDDIYGDLYFGNQRPVCCKSFDESGIVLWCGSVSKTLAPAYRVGWVAPGKFMAEVSKVKLFHSLSGTPITQEVVGDFLENGRYEKHLRTLRKTLYSNYLHYVRTITDCFPEGTKISRPQGGLSLWVELPPQIDTITLYNAAIAHKIVISPGKMFTLQDQFNNCMRLSYGLEWNDNTEKALQMLGSLAKKAML